MAGPWDDYAPKPAPKAAPKPVPARTKQQEIEDIARRRVAQGPQRTFTDRIVNGATFGLSSLLDDAISSVFTGRSFSDQRKIGTQTRDMQDAEAPISTLTGNFLGSLISGGPISGLIRSGGARIARSNAPAIIKATGKVINASQRLKQGQTLANAGKLAATGAAMGGVQSAAEGHDPLKGAAYGAGFGVGTVATGKLLSMTTHAAGDFLRSSSAQGVLRRITKMTREEMSLARERFRAANNGQEPTVFELLPLADRNRLSRGVIDQMDSTREATVKAVRARAANVGPQMRRNVEVAAGPRRASTQQGVEADLAASRGGQADPGDAVLARNALRDPTEMELVRETEARNIMAPHDNRTLFQSVEDLLPQHPQMQPDGTVQMVADDPDVTRVINSAAGILRLNPNGVTGRDVTDILSTLRGDARKGGIDGRAAQRAINHIEDTLASDHPEVADAVARMNAAYAGRSRMLEGMTEGGMTRTRNTVPRVDDRGDALDVRKLYDTPEATSGRQLGQANRLENDLSGTPEDVARAANEIANNPRVQAALAGNLGQQPADALVASAQTQQEGLRALAGLSSEKHTGAEQNLEDLSSVLLSMSPGSMIKTKIWGLSRLKDLMAGISEKNAMTLIDNLFSQDPQKVRAAMNMLNSVKGKGDQFLAQLSGANAGGRLGGDVSVKMSAPGSSEEMPSPQENTEPAEEGGMPWDDYANPEPQADAGGSGRSMGWTPVGSENSRASVDNKMALIAQSAGVDVDEPLSPEQFLSLDMTALEGNPAAPHNYGNMKSRDGGWLTFNSPDEYLAAQQAWLARRWDQGARTIRDAVEGGFYR